MQSSLLKPSGYSQAVHKIYNLTVLLKVQSSLLKLSGYSQAVHKIYNLTTAKGAV